MMKQKEDSNMLKPKKDDMHAVWCNYVIRPVTSGYTPKN